MSELRRRMMMQAASDFGDGYVQDGLVLCMDSSTFEGSIWTDPISGMVFTNNNGVLQSDGAVKFSYRWNGGVQLQGSGSLGVGEGVGTIEACFNGVGQLWINQSYMCLRTNGADGPVDQIKYITWRSADYGAYVTNLPVSKMSVSVSSQSGYINGQEMQYSSSQNTQLMGNALYDHECIGCNRNMWTSMTSFIGDLYCIRIYNRHLTKSELLHNLQIDNERFNLGL